MEVEQRLFGGISPTRDRVLEVAKQIVGEELGIDPHGIREGDALEADLGCDSLGRVEILMEVEEHFGISATDEVEEQIRTIGDIADGVLQLLGRLTTD